VKLAYILQILQGALIGLGAILPGLSGGVLCVIFGIYKPVMELLAHPFKNFKTHVPKLIPVGIGMVVGVLGVAKLLSFLLDKYEVASICVFIGLIFGMLPALWREAGEQGRNKYSYIALIAAMIFIIALLSSLVICSVKIVPNVGWYVFCGFCLALSVIAPGMSFSTLLMPLNLFEPFTNAIGNLDFAILVPAGIGAVLTVLCLVKVVNSLFEKHYSTAFHAIVGIVVSATIMIPFVTEGFLGSFINETTKALDIKHLAISVVCLIVGIAAALLLDKFNSSVSKE